jgi:hypothetical protein
MTADITRDYTQLTVDEAIALIEHVSSEARRDLGGLSMDQLNWKPSPAQWSVGECLEHLITSSGLYLTIVNSILAGNYRRPFLSRVPGYAGMCGRFLTRAVSPDARKVKTLSAFQPTRSSVDADEVARFEESQRSLADSMRGSKSLDLEATFFASPATSMIVYSLLDAWRLLATHGLRHLDQARRVTQADAFPTT